MSFKDTLQGIFVFLVFVFVVGFLFFGSQIFIDQNKASGLSSVSGAVLNISSGNIPQRNWQVQDLSINAVSAISAESDMDSEKILFSKNSDVKLPIASLTKLMTAIIVLDNYNLSDAVTISKDIDGQDEAQNDLKLGSSLSVENLLHIMLIKSSNESAIALSEKIGQQKFVELMIQKAKYIGLENTSFVEPTGLSNKNYSTAKDLLKLAKHILKNYPKIVEISGIKELDVQDFGKITNTNELLGKVSEAIGGKTGFTAVAKGCLLLVSNNPESNDYLIYVVLGSDDRFLEMKNIIDWVNAAYIWQ